MDLRCLCYKQKQLLYYSFCVFEFTYIQSLWEESVICAIIFAMLKQFKHYSICMIFLTGVRSCCRANTQVYNCKDFSQTFSLPLAFQVTTILQKSQSLRKWIIISENDALLRNRALTRQLEVQFLCLLSDLGQVICSLLHLSFSNWVFY